MTLIEGLFLGIVQGLTEFLPVSSSGHLVLLQKLLGISVGVMTFDIAVHFATLVAVIAVFWKDLVNMIKKPFQKINIMLIVATIPAFVLGFAFKDFFESLFASGKTLAIEFAITGAALLIAEKVASKRKNTSKDIEQLSCGDATFIGVAQAVAILPAVSRSGLTLAGALYKGLNREFALKFSFLMSIPAILGPALIDGVKVVHTGVPDGMMMPILFGMLGAGIAGYLSIRFMLNVFTKVSLKYFSIYVFVLAALVGADQLIFKRFF